MERREGHGWPRCPWHPRSVGWTVVAVTWLVLETTTPSLRAQSASPAIEHRPVVQSAARQELERLLKMPADQQRTPTHLNLLTQTAKTAGDIPLAADAFAMHQLLVEQLPANLKPVKAWLTDQGREHLRLAFQALGRGDRPAAIREYHLGIRCDRVLLGADDMGLRSICRDQQLERSRSGQQSARDRFDTGYYLYLFGELQTAKKELAHGLSLQSDPFKMFQAKFWLERVEKELAADQEAERLDALQESRQKEAREREDRAKEAKRKGEEAREAERKRKSAREEAEAQRKELDDQLFRLNLEISRLDAEIQSPFSVVFREEIGMYVSRRPELKIRREELLEARKRLRADRDALE